MPSEPEIHCLADAEAVAQEAARRILARAQGALTARGRFRLVLAGGSTPLAAYRLLARSCAEWSAWEVFFGDERCLPAEDPGRNSRATADVWLDQVAIPAAAVHPIAAEQGPGAAALAYAGLVSRAMPFDLVLLGMGEDGHTASLFPGRSIPADQLVIPVYDAPKPPSERVSLTPAAFRGAEEILVLITGASKRDALRRWRRGERLPVAEAAAVAATSVLVDAAAAC